MKSLNIVSATFNRVLSLFNFENRIDKKHFHFNFEDRLHKSNEDYKIKKVDF